MDQEKASSVIGAAARGWSTRRDMERKRVEKLSIYQKTFDPKLLAAKRRSLMYIAAFSFFIKLVEDGMKGSVITFLVLYGATAGAVLT